MVKGYLDNAATSAVLPCAQKAAMDAMEASFGNPSSLHAMGKRARDIMAGAREHVAEAFGCQAERVFFTSGGTESTNTALFSGIRKARRAGKQIIVTDIEHEATVNTAAALKGQGFEVIALRPGQVEEAIGENTAMVCMMAVNNETGEMLPYAACAAALKRKNPEALFYLDAVQGFCKTKLDLKNIDMAGASAHKIGGMKGCGALYVRPGLNLSPFMLGGGQESGLRSGTEGVPQIAAFGEACRYRLENREQAGEHVRAMRQRLFCGLEKIGGCTINSPNGASPYVVNISPGRGRSEVYIRILSDRGVYVSGGSACAKGRRSHVLAAMKLPAGNIDSALRVSFCPENTPEDVDMFLEGLKEAVKMF